MTHHNCPSIDEIELFSLGRIKDPTVAADIQEHVETCELCQEALKKADRFTGFMQALRQYSPKK